MTVEEFARSILFGGHLKDKLLVPDLDWDHVCSPLREVPQAPGRDSSLSAFGQSPFPTVTKAPSSRGQILHFFANHELLALEIMALALLKFPQAPESFRRGLVGTMLEEQKHMHLYLNRMRELGVDFGDLPLSLYFWNTMREIQTPMDFLVQMSLCFEQANLDFSLHYEKEVRAVGDSETGGILRVVYEDEIGHVAHGLKWFESLREPKSEPLWDAFCRHLPSPMTPRRAVGKGFDIAARLKAGIPQDFIDRLQRYSGSKGRPPVVWWMNPGCEGEFLNRGARKRVQEQVERDLSHLPMYLAADPDFLWVETLPREEWLTSLRELGWFIPLFHTEIQDLKDPVLGGLEPWGWSPRAVEKMRPLKNRLVNSDYGKLQWAKQRFEGELSDLVFRKSVWRDFLSERLSQGAHPHFVGVQQLGERFNDLNSAYEAALPLLDEGGAVFKASLGTSGNQIKRFYSLPEWESGLRAWVENTLRSQGEVLVQPLWKQEVNLSMQLEVFPDRIKVLGVRQFLVDTQWQYRGTVLGRTLRHLSGEVKRLLYEPTDGSCLIDEWNALGISVGEKLREMGYQGPAGIDGMVLREGADLKLHPLLECNPRYTMGRIALELEKRVFAETPAVWYLLPKEEGLKSFPGETVSIKAGLIEKGSVWTSDPERCEHLVSYLSVGSR